ncbi:MAG: glycosyltransferase family 4 protein [Caldilineaceae bacterium]|nr:glycosyltransferase family 4 protein [Caldilineaceae bacterium]
MAAVAQLLKSDKGGIDAHFVLIGDGDLKISLIRQAQSLGVGERTHFLGNIPNQQLPPYYAAADVTVLPSSPPESFGMVLIESMACGTPVIASDIAGVRSVVNHGVDGLLMRHGDGDDLVAQLQKMVIDAKLRQSMALAGRAKVERKYAWEKVCAKLSAMYHEIQHT